MNIRQRVLGTVGAVALGLSFVPTLALAQTTDTADTVVNVTCPETTSVDVNVNGQFEVDSEAGETSATLPGGFQIVLDLTCNWSSDFEVGAEIGTFEYQGTAPTGTEDSFSGAALLLTNGSGVYTGPDSYLLAGPPNIEETVFEGTQTSDDDVIENEFDIFIVFPVAIASPGVTTATWDGSLSGLPLNLADGEYIAPLTVTLSVN